MSKRWVVISYYTFGTDYEKEILKLKSSLKKFDIPYYFFSKRPLGNWRANLNYKSAVILEAFEKFPQKDIVFIDADGIVKQYPELFDFLSANRTHDIAVHYHHYKQSLPGGSLLSGTLWLRNCDKTKRLVERWNKIGQDNLDIRHQHCLNIAIREFEDIAEPMQVFKLPKEYAQIFDNFQNRSKPVIEHFQASRRLRRKVGYGNDLLDSNFLSLADKNKVVKLKTISEQPKAHGPSIVRTSDLHSNFHRPKKGGA